MVHIETQDDPPEWDPSQLFSGPESAEIARSLESIGETARRLSRDLRHRIAGLDSPALVRAIERYEECVRGVQLITSYAELLYGLHDQGPAAAALLGRCDDAWSELAVELDFFETELAARDEPTDEQAGAYAHFLRKVGQAGARRADPAVREALARLAPTGGEGWQRLARQLLNRIRIASDGGERGIGAVLPALYDGDRTARETAHAAINRALAGELDLRATALGMIVADGQARADLGEPDWLASRRLVDRLRADEVAALLSVAEECVPLVNEYYDFKRTAMAVDRLADHDRYAPLCPPDALGPISWPRAVTTVVDSFDAVHRDLGQIARRIVDGGAIDAAPRPGKQRNAFTRAVPGHLPCVSLNFTGTARDVLTLAHEMGHAAHFVLAAQQPLLAATPAPVTGESVALFCEAVTVRRLLAGTRAAHHQVIWLGRWLEDQMVAIGRHAALHSFEAALRTSQREDGPLDADRIGRLWLAGQRRLYGPAVELTDGYAMWWSYLTELFTQPGSHYGYVYGQLAALSLLDAFEADPRGFGPRFLRLLRAGDTHPPADLLAAAGVRTTDPADWRRAAATLRGRLARLRALTARARPGAPVPHAV